MRALGTGRHGDLPRVGTSARHVEKTSRNCHGEALRRHRRQQGCASRHPTRRARKAEHQSHHLRRHRPRNRARPRRRGSIRVPGIARRLARPGASTAICGASARAREEPQMCMHIHVDAYKRAAPPLLRAPHTPPHHTATRAPPSPLPGRRRRRRLWPTWTPSTRDRSRSCRHGHSVEHCAVLKCTARDLQLNHDEPNTRDMVVKTARDLMNTRT